MYLVVRLVFVQDALTTTRTIRLYELLISRINRTNIEPIASAEEIVQYEQILTDE